MWWVRRPVSLPPRPVGAHYCSKSCHEGKAHCQSLCGHRALLHNSACFRQQVLHLRINDSGIRRLVAQNREASQSHGELWIRGIVTELRIQYYIGAAESRRAWWICINGCCSTQTPIFSRSKACKCATESKMWGLFTKRSNYEQHYLSPRHQRGCCMLYLNPNPMTKYYAFLHLFKFNNRKVQPTKFT